MEQGIENHASFCIQKEKKIEIVKCDHKGHAITLEN